MGGADGAFGIGRGGEAFGLVFLIEFLDILVRDFGVVGQPLVDGDLLLDFRLGGFLFDILRHGHVFLGLDLGFDAGVLLGVELLQVFEILIQQFGGFFLVDLETGLGGVVGEQVHLDFALDDREHALGKHFRRIGVGVKAAFFQGFVDFVENLLLGDIFAVVLGHDGRNRIQRVRFDGFGFGFGFGSRSGFLCRQRYGHGGTGHDHAGDQGFHQTTFHLRPSFYFGFYSIAQNLNANVYTDPAGAFLFRPIPGISRLFPLFRIAPFGFTAMPRFFLRFI